VYLDTDFSECVTGNFPEASLESAEKCFLKAHELYANATNSLHLAKAYKLMGKPEKYKEWLEIVISSESVCRCVCVWERERERERELIHTLYISMCVCVCVCL